MKTLKVEIEFTVTTHSDSFRQIEHIKENLTELLTENCPCDKEDITKLEVYFIKQKEDK